MDASASQFRVVRLSSRKSGSPPRSRGECENELVRSYIYIDITVEVIHYISYSVSL